MAEQWTEEQHENARRYGVCRECGHPLEVRTEYDERGRPTLMGIVCPSCEPAR